MNLKKQLAKMFPALAAERAWKKKQKRNAQLIERIEKMTPDEYPKYLEEIYFQKTGHTLHLDAPERYTEKLQWRKLYDTSDVYVRLSDKYLVREWVAEQIGEEYLIPLLGVWDKFDDIDFSQLPDAFVLKTNNASGTNIIVKDKKEFLKKKRGYKKKVDYWMSTPYAYLVGLELHYNHIRPRIIAEAYLPPEENQSDLIDYKFHCFGGKPYCIQSIRNRTAEETVDFYDMEWNNLNFRRMPYVNAAGPVEKPALLEQMKEIATKLCKEFQYVRVDLYEHRGRIYFGEMTFTSMSGLVKFEPDEWDYRLGELWDIHAPQVKTDHSES